MYRIDLLHYVVGSGYTHTETIDNVDDIDFDFEEYLKDYFEFIPIKENEWYDAEIRNNINDDLITTFLNITIDFQN